jgi:TrpR-related protein YerC/YecD
MNDDKQLELLAKSLIKIRNIDEAKKYLMDMFSKTELKTVALRFQIAKMLSKGESYLDIERQTGASSATIAKISESLKYGNEGLKIVLERMKR